MTPHGLAFEGDHPADRVRHQRRTCAARLLGPAAWGRRTGAALGRCPEAERLTSYPSGVGSVPGLSDNQFDGHRLRRIPHPFDDVVAGVVGAYRVGSSAERQSILSEMTAKPAAVLCAYAERLAAIAVRTGSVEPLRQAVVAVGMAIGALDDDRDRLYPCAAVDHSAALLSTSFAQLVDSVAAELPPAALAKLRAFDAARCGTARFKRSGSGPTATATTSALLGASASAERTHLAA